MALIDHTITFTRRRTNVQLEQAFEKHSQYLEEKAKQGKCCSYVETGAHPTDDWHLCLRTKGHKGYHKDEFTNFSWKWEQVE